MQPVNTLKSLVNRNLKKLSVRRSTLAQRLGYHNVNRGLRRIDALLDADLDDEALVRRVAKVLMIPSWELEQALKDQHARKEKARLEQEAIERAKFEPSLTLVRPFPPTSFPTSFSDARGWSKRSRIPLPSFAPGITWGKERAGVFQCFQHALEAWRAESPGPKPVLAGFYYHQNYDHGFLFDTRGNLMREDHHHLDPYKVSTINTVNIEFENG